MGDKEDAELAELYRTHKLHGTIDQFYGMYPDWAPPGYFRDKREERPRER